VLAVRNRRSVPPLVIAVVLLLAGSLFVFRGETGAPAVHPLVAIVVSIGAAGLIWFLARKSVQAFGLRKVHDLDRLVGMTGTTRTDLRPDGSVYVGGENWTARCDAYIPAGKTVRVIRREGLVLDVEATADETK
jgi:membrane-bound ClpP family serine protease